MIHVMLLYIYTTAKGKPYRARSCHVEAARDSRPSRTASPGKARGRQGSERARVRYAEKKRKASELGDGGDTNQAHVPGPPRKGDNRHPSRQVLVTPNPPASPPQRGGVRMTPPQPVRRRNSPTDVPSSSHVVHKQAWSDRHCSEPFPLWSFRITAFFAWGSRKTNVLGIVPHSGSISQTVGHKLVTRAHSRDVDWRLFRHEPSRRKPQAPVEFKRRTIAGSPSPQPGSPHRMHRMQRRAECVCVLFSALDHSSIACVPCAGRRSCSTRSAVHAHLLAVSEEGLHDARVREGRCVPQLLGEVVGDLPEDPAHNLSHKVIT
jgi:hypothetical protein